MERIRERLISKKFLLNICHTYSTRIGFETCNAVALAAKLLLLLPGGILHLQQLGLETGKGYDSG